MTAVAIDLDAVLGDTRRLWQAWLADAARVLDAERLPDDRSAAADELDRRGAGNWRTLLHRFAEDHAPVYLRPNADAASALRRLEAAGVVIGVFTDAPAELASVALAHLGATRRVAAVETGSAALERLLERMEGDVRVVRTRSELASVLQAPSV